MTLVLASFIAGVLTIAAPCILPLLPVIIGGISIDGKKQSLKRPIIIVGSLALSVIIFSLLLKASTALLGIPTYIWQIISGGIVVGFGVNLLWPAGWERLMLATKLYQLSNDKLAAASKHSGYSGDILLGAALGPVFSSCSPTYALIVAIILPSSFASGLLYLGLYALGLVTALLLVALFGRTITTKLGIVANPKSKFRRIVGILFIVVGFAVIIGFDKEIQSFILDKGWYAPIENIEQSLIN